jgi:hypothetical protein
VMTSANEQMRMLVPTMRGAVRPEDQESGGRNRESKGRSQGQRPGVREGTFRRVFVNSNGGRYDGLWLGHGIFHNLKEVGGLLFGK